MPAPQLYTYRQVAARLGCDPKTVRRLVARELMPPPDDYEGIGPRFTEEHIFAYMARARKPPSSPKSEGQEGTGRDREGQGKGS